MKHVVTFLMLVCLGYFTWRAWPRTMKVYRCLTANTQRSYWKTKDYQHLDELVLVGWKAAEYTCVTNTTVASMTTVVDQNSWMTFNCKTF